MKSPLFFLSLALASHAEPSSYRHFRVEDDGNNTDRRQPRTGGLEFHRADGSTFTGHGLFAAISDDEGKTWPVRKLLTPGSGDFDGGAWTREFTATPDNAEHAGYLASTQSPDGVIHLISSRLHYRFNLAWLRQPAR